MSAPPAAPGRVPLVNPANVLTAMRLVLIPVFAIALTVSQMTHPGWRIVAALTFGIASVTDFVDGYIARTRNQVTAFGKVADPIADKALTGTALILLSGYAAIPWWVTIVILARELGITVLRFWVIRLGVIPVSRGGKLKTVLQLLAIGWYIWPAWPWLAGWAPWIMGAAVVVTVVTGIDYIVTALRLRRGPPPPPAARGFSGKSAI